MDTLVTLIAMLCIYEMINITWWLTTGGEDSFTQHIKFCIKNHRERIK